MADRPQLTPRTAEAIVLVAEGATYQQAAAQMGISPRTVKHYVYIVAREIGGREAPLVRLVRWYWRAHPARPFDVKEGLSPETGDD